MKKFRCALYAIALYRKGDAQLPSATLCKAPASRSS